MNRRSFLGAGAAAAVPVAVHAQDLPVLRVAMPLQEGAKTVYYAIKAGLFRRAGIAVEPVAISNGAAGLAALTGGSVDVVFTSMFALFQGFARGLPFQIVAPGQLYLSSAPTQALFVKRDSPIQRGADVNGKTVGIFTIKDINWAGTCNWIDVNGGDSRTVKFIELPPNTVTAALAEGRIDVGTLAAPFVEQAAANPDLRILAHYFDAVGKQFEIAVFIANKPSTSTARDVLARFARAMHDSTRYVNAHQGEMVSLIADFAHLEPAIVARGTRTVDPEYVDVRDIQPLLDLSVKYKLLERAFDPNDLIAPTALRAQGRS
jgi:NitT/TauT family transport system substrate-binding protein